MCLRTDERQQRHTRARTRAHAHAHTHAHTHTRLRAHTDDRVRALSPNAYADDALIVAGDVSDDLAVLRATLEELVARFAHVLFVPGNHDLWTRRGERERYDSIGTYVCVCACVWVAWGAGCVCVCDACARLHGCCEFIAVMPAPAAAATGAATRSVHTVTCVLCPVGVTAVGSCIFKPVFLFSSRRHGGGHGDTHARGTHARAHARTQASCTP